ncbi:MAG: electron transport complex subunit RsxG [Methylococcaceae bacterium]|nr:electron transport complex subunit RsxG [Methylococcaceae bacterium]MDZ4156358.1 electron transport complex subunit RsxG [Methylococcales bacterium]MDP2394619.1 electron transport complex subunit RsxG [Methylococcaceae bacterium]MDP3019087.1 electron transport complex subunit RsxG [Methylococcaceae bacterium]MDP3390303.1 electron transport complex subunit RsxG [Methylococcaceae bacterium]
MKINPATTQLIQDQAANYLEWLKRWLEPANLARLRPKLEFQTGILAGFALLASVLLGVTNFSTEGTIQRRLDEDLIKSLEEVVPAGLHDNDMLQDTLTIPSAEYNIGANETIVYLAKKSGKVTAVCYKFIAPDGYSGAINMIMGVDRDGNILGVRVLNHKETPGLGDKIEVAKSDWILKFVGRSLDNLTPAQWAVKKDGGEFDQFAGATITPRKSVQAIYRSLQLFKAHQEQLINQALTSKAEQ